MNLRQTWAFFKIALQIQKHPGQTIFTSDRHLYNIVKAKYPGQSVVWVPGKK